MEIRPHVLWKNTARQRLEQAQQPQKLVLLHAGVMIGAQLLLAVLTLLLSGGIEQTGGLSGIGMRSVLTTAQTFLQYAVAILLPFWEIGFLRAALQFARGQEATPKTLTMGLRRFGPVLRLILLQGLIGLVLMVACVNVGSLVFTLTPMAKPLLELMEPLMQATTVEEMDAMMMELPMEEVLAAMIPALVISAVLFLVAYLPVFYRIRMAEFAVMDEEKTGAFAALTKSLRITKGNVLSLVRLDLSFWWFYALQIPIAALGYGDVLLRAIGVQADGDLLYLVFFCLQAGAQLLLYWQMRAQVQTSYAAAYDALSIRNNQGK